MGTCGNMILNNNNKEICYYKGEIYFNNDDQQKNQDYKHIVGSLIFNDKNNKKLIVISGENKQSKIDFYFSCIEKYKVDPKQIYFKITEQNSAYQFKFYEDILIQRINKDCIIIKGKTIFSNEISQTNLVLHLDNTKKELNDVVISDYRIIIKSLKNPIDIVSNSVFGMRNLMNTCYINSSFQILIHISELVEIFINNKGLIDLNDLNDNVIRNVNLIFNDILKYHKEIKYVIDPSIFVANFKKTHQEYNNSFQFDSEMFLEELIWNINFELSSLNLKRTKKNLNSLKGNVTFISDKENMIKKQTEFLNYIDYSEEDCYYKINDLFYVCYVHTKKCVECGYISYYFDETTGLKLNFYFNNYETPIDLNTLIKENFINPVKIKLSFICKNCKKTYYVEETTKIAKLPKILIICLQKTDDQNTRKFSFEVNYSSSLKLDQYVDKSLINIDIFPNRNCTYKLFAINNHIGNSPRSGHYYSMICLEKLNNTWFTFNDESVYKISKPNPSINNYVLFYKQI